MHMPSFIWSIPHGGYLGSFLLFLVTMNSVAENPLTHLCKGVRLGQSVKLVTSTAIVKKVLQSVFIKYAYSFKHKSPKSQYFKRTKVYFLLMSHPHNWLSCSPTGLSLAPIWNIWYYWQKKMTKGAHRHTRWLLKCPGFAVVHVHSPAFGQVTQQWEEPLGRRHWGQSQSTTKSRDM